MAKPITKVWLYKSKEITNIQQLKDVVRRSTIYGIVYKITYSDGKYILGTKKVEGNVSFKPKPGNVKRPNHIRWNTRGSGVRRFTTEVCYEEYNWKEFGGTNLHTARPVNKEILQIGVTGAGLKYLYTKELFKHDAIEDNNCLNECIGKLYTKEDLKRMQVELKLQSPTN